MQSENTISDVRNNSMISNPALTKWKQISCWEGDVENWEMHYLASLRRDQTTGSNTFKVNNARIKWRTSKIFQLWCVIPGTTRVLQPSLTRNRYIIWVSHDSNILFSIPGRVKNSRMYIPLTMKQLTNYDFNRTGEVKTFILKCWHFHKVHK